MFDSAANRYVLSNKVLTFCQDERWRQAAVDVIQPETKIKILDICTGTADLALKIAKRFPHSTIYGLDFSQNMLGVAKERAEKEGLNNLIFEIGNCANMGFESDYFNYVTISFGFRNLSYSRENLNKALREIYRVLKHGGRFVIIETSQPANIFIRKLFHFYAANIVPKLGRLFSGKKEPYAYLGSSIVRFFKKEELADALESFGFRKERASSFMCGAILLFVARKF